MTSYCARPRKLLYGGVLFFMSLVFILYMDLLPEHEDEGEGGEFKIILPEENDTEWKKKPNVYLPPEEQTDLPTIVWWTPFTPFQRLEKKCSKGTCLFTQSRTELNNSRSNVSVFMYYGTDFRLEDLPLPRKPHHLWALLHEESPKNNWILATEKGISLFNITSTFSRYSDYPLHLHYLHTLTRLLHPVRTPTHLKSKGGLALVMFMQSGCNPPSDRDSYVEELMKYISVDSYGRCLHNKDLPDHLINTLTFGYEDVLEIAGKYKFVLSFENALCHDYFTEKFWRPFYAGSVPIVRGSPTIRDWDPSVMHPSMILADDFNSPRDLGEYLLKLDRDSAAYERYLEYKKIGVTNRRLLDHFKAREWVVDEVGLNFIEGFECFVCDRLHERRNLQEQYAKDHVRKERNLDLIIANISHYDCLSPKPSVRLKSQSIDERLSEMKDGLELHNWMWSEKCAADKARITAEAISRGADQRQLDEALTKSCQMV